MLDRGVLERDAVHTWRASSWARNESYPGTTSTNPIPCLGCLGDRKTVAPPTRSLKLPPIGHGMEVLRFVVVWNSSRSPIWGRCCFLLLEACNCDDFVGAGMRDFTALFLLGSNEIGSTNGKEGKWIWVGEVSFFIGILDRLGKLRQRALSFAFKIALLWRCNRSVDVKVSSCEIREAIFLFFLFIVVNRFVGMAAAAGWEDLCEAENEVREFGWCSGVECT